MNSKHKKKILITFGRSFLTLDLARKWHAQGHEVFVADSISSHVSRFSNTVSKCFTVPSPRFEPEAYLNALVHIVEKEKIDLLIPIYEEITHLSKGVDRFPSFCKVFCPTFALYEQLQNKWSFQELLQSLGIPTLKRALVRNKNDFKTHLLPMEYALKPCYSRASQKVLRIDAARPIPDIGSAIEPHNPWIAQEWAYGKKYCTYSICHEGAIYAHGTYPVNYAIDGNSCISFEVVHHQKILDWIALFVKKIGFSGQIAFDFIESVDGILYAIECNPRATSGLLLFDEMDGLDQAFLKQNEKPIFPKNGTSRQVATGMLLYGWRKSSRQGRSLGDFFKTFFCTKDVIFSVRDPKPFILEPIVFVNLYIQSRKLKISLPNCFTHDHDWNNCKE
ncbi:MAG: hypothetical protein WCF65_04025 [Parachlamydiaceae bacterium]